MRYKKTNRKNRDFSAIFPLKISKQKYKQEKKYINRKTKTKIKRHTQVRGKGTEEKRQKLKKNK